MTIASCTNTAWTTVKSVAITTPLVLCPRGGNILFNTTEAAADLSDGTIVKGGDQVVLPVGCKLYVIASGAATVSFQYQDFPAE